MVKVSYDDEHNTVIIEFEGNIDAAQAESFFSDVEKVLPKPGKGFKLLTDFSSVQTMELAVKDEIKKAMGLFNARGVTEILRVLPDPDMDIGLNIMSRSRYSQDVKIVTLRSREEALARLRNEKKIALTGDSRDNDKSELLDFALQAHGGLERWREVQSLDVRVSLTGGLYRVKGYPEGVPNVNMKIDARRPSVTITPYSRPDGRGYFTPDRVWIEDGAGRIVDERDHPRDSFAGHVLETPWDQLHRLYFTSYAMWNYLTTPFLLARPGFECREIEPHQENGETWRCLQVNFPPDIPTHNKEQTFFFNDQGLLQRLDYVAVGPASHYCYDHTTFGGLVFPTLRRVVRRTPSGPLVSGPTAVLIQIADVAVA